MLGTLEIITGCMFAGKTTAFVRKIKEFQAQGKRVGVFKPALDLRYSDQHVVTHDGLSVQAQLIDSDLRNVNASHFDVIAIDEVQFLSQDAVTRIQNYVKLKKYVLLSGLDTDWRARAFPTMCTLLAYADKVTKKTARCAVCGQTATRTHRKVPEEGVILVGGADKYEPRCLLCHPYT